MTKMWAAVAALLVTLVAHRAAADNLGPGSGPWKSEPAEKHGLSSAALAAAAVQVAAAAPQRHCVLVIKDGVLVHERYFGTSTADSRYESDSLGKQGTSLVLAMAASKGLIDLDTPLAHYGVNNTGDDGAAGSWPAEWWPKVTARHLLSQTGGCVTGGNSGVAGFPQCYSPPGTNWTYDSEDFVGHLSKLITAASGMPAVEWATKHFAEAIGIPHLYAEDGAGSDFVAGGGQLMTCRQHARVGQLLANMGAWPAAVAAAGGLEVGNSEQLITTELCKQILTPQMPNASKSYGLLTWLGGATADPHGIKCCAPRWGDAQCSGKQLLKSIIGDDVAATGAPPPPDLLPPLLPTDVGVGMGWLGQYMYVLPSERLVVVSLGESWGESVQCNGDKANGYDDAFSVTQVWRAFRNATVKGMHARSPGDEAAAAAHMADARRHAEAEAAGDAERDADRAKSDAKVEASDEAGGGACQCSCPPGRGFGFCFEMPAGTPKSDAGCAAVDATAPRFCPGVGVPKQCNDPPSAGDLDCKGVGENMHGDVGNPLVWGGILNCTVSSKCSSMDGDTRFSSGTCDCKPWRFGPHGCEYFPTLAQCTGDGMGAYFPATPYSK